MKNKNHDREIRSLLWKAFLKLEALGIMLELQGQDCEGFTELAGLGLILTELSTELRHGHTLLAGGSVED
jgi:hypothetical protein